VAQDPEAPAPEEQDPIEDSPEPEASDSGQDSPEPQQPTDEGTAEARLRATQAALTRKNREAADLQRKIEALESRRPDGVEPSEPETPRERELRERVEAYEWQTAESVYGPELMEVYTASAELYAADPTPSGALASYEAYHQARSAQEGKVAAPAAAGERLPTRSEAVQPRVDANRQDAAVLSQLDHDVEEAKRAGSLDNFITASMKRAGLRS